MYFVIKLKKASWELDPQTMVKINVKKMGYYNVDILPEDCP